VALLYNRDELFRLVAQLVGLAFNEDRRLTSGHHSDLPIVVVVGGHGTGKTAALEEIARAYGNRAPRVRLDLAARRYSEEWAGLDSGATPLLRILTDLKWDLELLVRHSGRLHFPRLKLALLAIATWQPDSQITVDQARQRLAEARASVARIAHDDRDEWVNGWISDVVAGLSAGAVPFPMNVFLQASVRAFTAKALNASHRRAALTWHEDYDPRAPGDGYEALITMGRDFHLGGGFRARSEQALVAAMLADLSAEYRGLSRITRVAFPLALLDNVDVHPAGTRFLHLVLGNRARPETDPLVIVASGPEYLLTRMVVPDPSDGRPPHRSADQPDTRLHRVDLTKLDQDHVLRMLDMADPRRLPPDLAHLIHRLTGGLPLGVDVITRAVAYAAPAASPPARIPPVADASTLDLPVPEAARDATESVACHLLHRLVPDHSWRSRLITLAPACDPAAAQALVTAHLATDQDRLTVPEAEELLRANGWESSPEHFVGDPFLRTLLLHQLHRRKTQPTSAEVHATLRDHYGGGGTGLLAHSEPARLYHCLALGDAAHVVRRLHDSFADSPADTWLDALRRVTCAPHGSYPDHRRDVALGAADQNINDETYRSINRLLHAAWFLTDPLTAPDVDVIDKLADELKFLATQHPTGNRVLSQASRIWPARLKAWDQTCDRPTQGE
jgi:hypothetical protein